LSLSGGEKELTSSMRSLWRLKFKRKAQLEETCEVLLHPELSVIDAVLQGPPVESSLPPLSAERTADLVKRHVNGDPQAFSELVNRFGNRVYGYLSKCGVNAIERDDLFQEIFLRVHRAAQSYQPDRPFEPWLFTIVANVARSHFRKRPQQSAESSQSADNQVGAIQLPSGLPSAEDVAEMKETASLLSEGIKSLSEPQRVVLLLSVYERLELKQIADTLGYPLNTVKTHLRRARLELAERLAKAALKSKREVGV
jgi:RNA polymerase sigma-70 factor, ECF subfamily